MPCVAQVAEQGLEFTRPVTFLVGDNGSGKSTLVEAIAEGFRLDPYGGRAAACTERSNPTKTLLGEVLRLDTTAAGARILDGSHRSGWAALAAGGHRVHATVGSEDRDGGPEC